MNKAKAILEIIFEVLMLVLFTNGLITNEYQFCYIALLVQIANTITEYGHIIFEKISNIEHSINNISALNTIEKIQKAIKSLDDLDK